MAPQLKHKKATVQNQLTSASNGQQLEDLAYHNPCGKNFYLTFHYCKVGATTYIFM